MLYSITELRSLNAEDGVIAIKRYFNKIYKKEGSRLCPHEHEFLALRLRSIFKGSQTNNSQELVLHPYSQSFLDEAVFKYLILLYFDNLDFLQPVYRGNRLLTTDEIIMDKQKFIQLQDSWHERLQSGKKDKILHEVKIEILHKNKLLNSQVKARLYGKFVFERKLLEQRLISFYIYYNVKIFFKNFKADHVAIMLGSRKFVFNAYSYVHILSRHYIPKFNGIDFDKSFNDELPFIDVFNLPLSVTDLIANYVEISPIPVSVDKEYLIFKYKANYYILWWKAKRITEIGNESGYEIRTFYKIVSQADKLKVIGLVEVKVDQHLTFCY